MVSGKGTAWDRLSKPNNDLSNVILTQEGLNDQKRKEEQNRKDLENAKKEKNLNNQAKALSGINSGKRTKYLHFEHSLTDAFRKQGGLIDKFTEAQKILENDPANTEALAIKTNIEKQVQRIAGIKNTILGYNKKLAEGIASGKISKKLNEGYLTNMDRINNGEVEFEIGDYGDVRILNKGNVDLDGDGLPDEISLESLSDINNFGVWEADFNLNGLNENLKKQFAEQHTKNDNGTFTTTEKSGYNLGHTEDVRNKYREVLGLDANSLTNQGKSFLYQKGLTPQQVKENPALYEGLINDLELGFRNLYKSKDFETTDHGAINSRERNAISRSKSKKEDKPKNSLRTTVDGIMVGDYRFLKNLVDQKLEEQGSDGKDIYIRDIEYANGKIIMALSDKRIKEIDTGNEQQAVAEILKLVRPNDKPDLREEEYRKGVVEVEYKPSNNKYSRLTFLKEINSLPETSSEDEIIPFLKERGVKAKAKGVINNVVEVNGKEFKIGYEKGMESFKQYLKDNYRDLFKKKENEDSSLQDNGVKRKRKFEESSDTNDFTKVNSKKVESLRKKYNY
ncbi:hypothetical protein SAMN04489761_4275 [Tenacibaculum sp. MAR_2009_124]|uniref:hypothetical protein n=1 Tax=Tenacibaculum sp. MAR_2009_124 TaxID=1250059 RepID=UPI0008960083|nr:hypothetical protein [Tenacibaculum sp. MAR_2009_124]SED10085.1 hypothetical protein SAMN04489761_4275 [Tenacibaculum sp. MAR_2009_124]